MSTALFQMWRKSPELFIKIHAYKNHPQKKDKPVHPQSCLHCWLVSVPGEVFSRDLCRLYWCTGSQGGVTDKSRVSHHFPSSLLSLYSPRPHSRRHTVRYRFLLSKNNNKNNNNNNDECPCDAHSSSTKGDVTRDTWQCHLRPHHGYGVFTCCCVTWRIPDPRAESHLTTSRLHFTANTMPRERKKKRRRRPFAGRSATHARGDEAPGHVWVWFIASQKTNLLETDKEIRDVVVHYHLHLLSFLCVTSLGSADEFAAVARWDRQTENILTRDHAYTRFRGDIMTHTTR